MKFAQVLKLEVGGLVFWFRWVVSEKAVCGWDGAGWCRGLWRGGLMWYGRGGCGCVQEEGMEALGRFRVVGEKWVRKVVV